MKKWVWFLVTVLLITPILVRAADTRIGSQDIKKPACYTATTVGGSTCYTTDVASTLSGTAFTDIKLIAGTNPRMPGLWGRLDGTTSVSVTDVSGTQSNDLKLISGTSPATPGAIGALGGTTSVTVQAGTVAVSNIAGGTIAVSNLAGGTVAVSNLAGGTIAVSNVAGGTIAVSSVAGGTISALPVGTQFVSVTGITGTTYANVIPNAIVTEGVGNKTVSASGTSLRLASQAARQVVIKANCANTNYIYVVPGGTTSQDYSSTANPGGIELDNCESITLPLISNISEIVIDATTSAEGINYAWVSY